VVSGHTKEKEIRVWHLNAEDSQSCESRDEFLRGEFRTQRCNSCAEKIFPQIVMNSFSTDFKRRAITATIVILCG
jgi:hypothetical protein